MSTSTPAPAPAPAAFLPAITPETAAARIATFRTVHPQQAALCSTRLISAATIATATNKVSKLFEPALFSVVSQSNHRGAYTVNMAAKTCTCPDAGTNAGIPCKHRLAIGILTDWKPSSYQSPAALEAPAPTAAPVQTPAAPQAAPAPAAPVIDAPELTYIDPVDILVHRNAITLYNGVHFPKRA